MKKTLIPGVNGVIRGPLSRPMMNTRRKLMD
jgi:hypothetical protein